MGGSSPHVVSADFAAAVSSGRMGSLACGSLGGVNDAELVGVRPFELSADARALRLLDQRQLPTEEVWLELREVEDVARAIEDLAVRGAPAIGCVAALGVAVAAQGLGDETAAFRAAVESACDRLARTRPTAVNLFVALDQMREVLRVAGPDASVAELRERLRSAAQAHVDHDLQACLAIGRHGASLLPDQGGVLTHCNAGALATAGHGTALGVIRRAHALGKRIQVYADETRPVLQGARLTAWELARDAIPVCVIADNMAGALMASGRIKAAIVGADRIARNGDVANKIGTYTVAVLCRHHGIPFYVAAPWTTIDLDIETGRDIPIEERSAAEVRTHGGRCMTPPEIAVCNPAFDVTPAELVDAIITDRGVFAASDLAKGRPSDGLSKPY
jgi:methylthioribose-1-phosphate isomerase